MTKSIAYCTLIVSMAIVVVLSVYAPSILSDDNDFLKGFVNHEFLNVLGVILAITIASAAQIHLAFNRIEEQYGHRGLVNSRKKVHSAAHWLIGLFLCAVALVVIKPLIAGAGWSQTLFNGAAIFILVWYALLLITLTQTIFSMKPKIDEDS